MYPVIYKVSNYSNCSCTILWLFQYSNYYSVKNSDILSFLDEKTYKQLLCTVTDDLLQECNFKSILYKCQFQAKRPVYDQINVFYDKINGLFNFEFTSQIVLVPLFCIIGLIFNIFSIVVLRNNNKINQLQHKLFAYFKINSIFNLFYCIMMIMHLFLVCIVPGVFTALVITYIQNHSILIGSSLNTFY